ncbi:MAG: hypothetical protein ABJI69_11640 [Balneola sp.]
MAIPRYISGIILLSVVFINQPEDEISLGSIFDEPRLIDCLDDGWKTVTEFVHVNVIQKNDGVTTPNHSTWNKNDNVYSENSNNFYYDDTGDGGYNHMEIRRLRRTYNDSGNGIVKGEKAKPMREAEEWLTRDIIK